MGSVLLFETVILTCTWDGGFHPVKSEFDPKTWLGLAKRAQLGVAFSPPLASLTISSEETLKKILPRVKTLGHVVFMAPLLHFFPLCFLHRNPTSPGEVGESLYRKKISVQDSLAAFYRNCIDVQYSCSVESPRVQQWIQIVLSKKKKCMI